MIVSKAYDVWNGKEVIGKYVTISTLSGNHVIFPEECPFKQSYFRKTKEIKCPLVLRKVYDDGVEVRLRKTIDVRRKSKRQINIILNGRTRLF